MKLSGTEQRQQEAELLPQHAVGVVQLLRAQPPRAQPPRASSKDNEQEGGWCNDAMACKTSGQGQIHQAVEETNAELRISGSVLLKRKHVSNTKAIDEDSQTGKRKQKFLIRRGGIGSFTLWLATENSHLATHSHSSCLTLLVFMLLGGGKLVLERLLCTWFSLVLFCITPALQHRARSSWGQDTALPGGFVHQLQPSVPRHCKALESPW